MKLLYNLVPKNTILAIITLSLILAALTNLFKNLNTIPVHIDEWMFMGKSYYFDLLFLKGDLKDPRWYINDKLISDPSQPKLGPYIYSIVLHRNGINDIDSYLKSIGYMNVYTIANLSSTKAELSSSRTWLHQGGSENIMNLIHLGRKTSTFFAILSLLLIYAISSFMKGNRFALITLILLSTNPLFLLVPRRAMTDAMLLFFTLISLILIKKQAKFIQKKTRTKSLVAFAILSGISIGLALSTKVTGILLVPILLLINLISFVKSKKNIQSLKITIFMSILPIITMLILFTSLHPYVYNNKPYNLINIFTNRLKYELNESKRIPERLVNNRTHAFEIIYNNLIFHKGNYALIRHPILPLNEALLILGAVFMVQKARRTKDVGLSWEMLILSWFLITFIALLFYLHTDWPRYYLPLFIPTVLIQVYALDNIINYIWKKLLYLNTTKKNI